MKGIFLMLELTLLTGRGYSQTADSLMTVKLVDSLLAKSDELFPVGKAMEALPFAQQAADVSKEKWGENHAMYAASLHGLGSVYVGLLQFDKAEEMFLKAIDLRAKIEGKEGLGYAASMVNLAILYIQMGDYAQAEPLCLEVVRIFGKELGKEHPNYALILNNLASLYHKKGDYAKAEPLYLESKEIVAKVLGKDHRRYGTALNNLATLYQDRSEFDKAEKLHLEVKDIRAKTLGKEHPYYANTLNNLANLYSDKGDYEKAEPLYLESAAIRAKVFGKEDPEYAESLNNLATLYHEKDDYTSAEPLLLEAMEIKAKAYGKQHPSYAESSNNLAQLYQITNRIPESTVLFLELSQLNRLFLEKAAAYSSETEMLAYLQTFESKIARFQSFSQEYPSPELSRSNYDNTLFFNGFLLENARRLARSLAGADSLTQEIFERWQSCRRRLADEYSMPVAERHAASIIAQLEADAESYEKALTRDLSAFDETRKVPHWQDVRDHLPKGSAAVEFIHYRYFNPKATDSVFYAALVLIAGVDQPEFIPLFEEKQLAAMFRNSGTRKSEYVNDLYGAAGLGGKTDNETLYEILWEPLKKGLVGINTVYFSPSGLLLRINLAAVPTPNGQTLADRYNLVELGSTRQLAVNPTRLTTPSRLTSVPSALLFGGIQYEMDTTAIAAANLEFQNTDFGTRGETPDFSKTDSTARGGTWAYLKWTEKEVAAIEPVLAAGGINPTTLKGYAATEEAFKAMGKSGPSPRVLHIATHGFFFPDPKSERTNGERVREDEAVFKISDHPMIRSGLLLAGANQAWKTGLPAKPGMEDGILTAYEISQMNLSNTELVVLSACETGLGDIQGNEGVYGLQRAFKIAGAKYLIMSLWQVPDFQTQELMTVFYKKWLGNQVVGGDANNGLPIPEAFRAAQKEMREKYEHPYFWAGFVLVE